MKIYAFKVEHIGAKPSFDSALYFLNQQPFANRLFESMRLEQVSKRTSGIACEFVKLRDAILPGKATTTQATQALGLAANESVSEETAGFYFPSTQTLLLQLNIHGPQRKAIEYYMNRVAVSIVGAAAAQYELSVYIDQTIQTQFNRLGLFRRLEFSVATPPVSNTLAKQGASLGSLVDLGLAGGVRGASIELKAGRSKSSSLNRNFVRDALRHLRRQGEDLQALKVAGKEHADARIVILDLLEAVVKKDVHVHAGPDRRLPLNARWDALEAAHADWTSRGLLP